MYSSDKYNVKNSQNLAYYNTKNDKMLIKIGEYLQNYK